MKIKLRPDENIHVDKIKIRVKNRKIPLLILSPKERKENAPGILWIHGGGYFLGMKEMIYMSRAIDLVVKYKAVVVVPGYTLAFLKPYPAALEDCYESLLYLKEHTKELGINDEQIMVGGESAGGGLCAAVCILARDKQEVNISYQMPLYPMIDNFDTDSSRDNHNKIWNTRRNHFGWKMYLRKEAKQKVSPYQAPSRLEDYHDLPPAYSFVCDKEPFYDETVTYFKKLQEAGVEAKLDIYPGLYHAFDMIEPDLELSQLAIKNFNQYFEYALKHYYAKQKKISS